MPALPSGVRGAVITGWGTALPPKILTNKDLEQMMDTSDEWIVERSGIRQRHVGGTTVGLSTESGRAALDMSGVDLGRDRRAGARNDHPRHAVGQRCGSPERARPAVRCLRRQRGVLGFRLRTRHRPRDDRHGCSQGVADRHRLAVADRRLGRPQHGDLVRRRLGSRRARGRRGARAVALLGSRR